MPIYNTQTKMMEDKLVKIRLCPVQLWDISYPIHHRDALHTTLFGAEKGRPIHKMYNKFIWAVRKVFGLEPLPEYKTDSWLPMDFPQHIEVIGLGVKDDYWIEPDGKHSSTEKKSKDAYEGI